MTLYELDQAILAVLEAGFKENPETGEIIFDQEDLEELQADREQKWDNIACFIKDQQALAESIRNEEQALARRRKKLETKTEYLKNYLLSSMQAADTKKVETARNALSIRKSKSVKVLNEDEIPQQFWKTKTATILSKTDIAKAIKEGQNVPGAILQEQASLTVK
jgi:hypothetical protein